MPSILITDELILKCAIIVSLIGLVSMVIIAAQNDLTTGYVMADKDVIIDGVISSVDSRDTYTKLHIRHCENISAIYFDTKHVNSGDAVRVKGQKGDGTLIIDEMRIS